MIKASLPLDISGEDELIALAKQFCLDAAVEAAKGQKRDPYELVPPVILLEVGDA